MPLTNPETPNLLKTIGRESFNSLAGKTSGRLTELAPNSSRNLTT